MSKASVRRYNFAKYRYGQRRGRPKRSPLEGLDAVFEKQRLRVIGKLETIHAIVRASHRDVEEGDTDPVKGIGAEELTLVENRR